jgi:hypothetical protein
MTLSSSNACSMLYVSYRFGLSSACGHLKYQFVVSRQLSLVTLAL